MQFDGSLGNGIMAGAGLGVAFCALGAMYMAHTLRTRPVLAMQAFAISFLMKLVVLVVGAIAFRYIPQAAARVDYRGFMVAYAALIAVLVPVGSFDALRGIRQQINSNSLPAQSESGL
jgi:hypothetical protein